MKKEKLKWHFSKISIVELNDNALKKIKGGVNDVTDDPIETTKLLTYNDNSTDRCIPN